MIGLGDEFELPGSENQVPDDTNGNLISIMYSNLIYQNNPVAISPSSEDFKWRSLFPSSFDTALQVHPHPGNINTEDRTLPVDQLSYSSIGLWEGGGGYSSKVYRPAFDCLLRRRIGDNTLPVKNKKVELYPVCEATMQNKLSL